MKKLFLILALTVFSSFAFVSCEYEEDNEMVDTVWSAPFGNDILWIEFTSNNQFEDYTTDPRGNYIHEDDGYGTYDYNPDYVTFITHNSPFPFDFAKVEGNEMTVVYKSGYTLVFNREY